MEELAATPRTELGKKTHALRKEGFLPAVVYGEGIEAESISVGARDFEKIYRQAGESAIFILSLRDKKKLNVMIHDVAYDPLTSRPMHADFYSVRMDKEIEAKVPFLFAGDSPAVKNEGGILVKVMHEVEVRALPKDLPHEIRIDIARLETIGGRLQVKDIAFPGGVKVRADENEVIALVAAPRTEEELQEATTAAPETMEVKTEREIKLEEKAAKETEEKTTEEAA